MTAYTRTAAPHIRDSDSVARIFWLRTAVLVPALAALLWVKGWPFLLFLPAALAGAGAAHGLGAWLLHRPFSWKRGDIYPGACLLAVMATGDYSPPAAFLAAAVSFLICREIFGGFGAQLFHPAILGVLLLETSRPAAAGNGSWFVTFMIAVGGIVLVRARQLAWELPALFYAAASIAGWGQTQNLFSAPEVAAGAFFLLSDLVTTPTTRSGRRYFAAAAGVLSGVLIFAFPVRLAVGFAFLGATALVPWLDIFVRPKGAERKFR